MARAPAVNQEELAELAAGVNALVELRAKRREAHFSASFLELVTPDAGAVLGATPLRVGDPLRWLLAPAIAQGQVLPLDVSKPPRSDVYAAQEVGRLVQVEPIGPPTTAALDATARVWELTRIQVPAGQSFTLERLATYLRVVAAGGVETLYVWPIDPYVALDDGLEVAWILGIVWGDDIAAGPFLAGAPRGAALPMGPVDGFPVRWADLRYAFGSPYTERHQSIVQGPATVRLLVEGRGQGFSIVASGLISGHLQGQSKGQRANATLRS